MAPISNISPTSPPPSSEKTSEWQPVIERHHEVDSTMRVAREAAYEGAQAGHVIVATEQRDGRGRSGAAWLSERGRGVWATLVLDAPVHFAPSSLSPAMALAVCQAAHALGVGEARIKWPNDILVGEHKLAGLLLEQGQRKDGSYFVLVGIGLNLMAPTSKPKAGLGKTMLEPIGLIEAGAPPGTSTDAALDALLRAVGDMYAHHRRAGFSPLAASFDAWHVWRGRRVIAAGAGQNGEDWTGIVGDIGAEGQLALETRDGPRMLVSATLRLADSSGL